MYSSPLGLQCSQQTCTARRSVCSVLSKHVQLAAPSAVFSVNSVPLAARSAVFSVNMPDPIRKRFGYCKLWPLTSFSKQNGPDRIFLIPLPASDSVPFFQRRLGSYCAKPARIRYGLPGQVLAKRIRSGSKPVCKNHTIVPCSS